MLIPVFEWLQQHNVIGAGLGQFITFRAVAAFMVSLVIATIFGGKFVIFLRRHQIQDDVRDIGVAGLEEKKKTPTMGGVIIFCSILISALLFCNLNSIYSWLLIITTVVLTGLGFLDDYIKVFRHNKEGLSGKWKIVGQVSLATIVGITLYTSSEVVIRENISSYKDTNIERVEYSHNESKSTKTTIPFVKGHNFDYKSLAVWLPDSWQQTAGWIIFIIVAIFIITGTSNGSNLTDGLDGLTAGICAIIGVGMMVLAYLSSHVIYAAYLNIMYIPGAQEVFVFASAFTGACMGFLWYNGYPAKVFMGDTGSLMLGGGIAVMALILRKEIMLVFFCGVFLIESISVMMQTGYYKLSRKITGKPVRIFRRAPLHHHFQKGIGEVDCLLKKPADKWHEQTIVLRFWLISILLCAFAILTLKIR